MDLLAGRGTVRGYSQPEVFVDIPPGSSTGSIGNRLVDAGVVRDARTFQVALWISGRARDRSRPANIASTRRCTPSTSSTRSRAATSIAGCLTFREGLTIAEMAQVFEERGFGTAADFRKAAENAALILDLDPGARDLEGYLFPETYALPRGTTAAAWWRRWWTRSRTP